MSDLPMNPLVLIGIGSSFAFSGLFYHLYKEKKRELKALKASDMSAVNLTYSLTFIIQVNLLHF